MKIAFASSTGEKIDQHFGWSKTFYLYEVDKEDAVLVKTIQTFVRCGERGIALQFD